MADEGLFLLDRAGRVAFVNPAAERMFGWSLDEMRGRTLHDLVHPIGPDGLPLPGAKCPVVRALARKSALRGHEDVFRTRSGRRLPVECSVTPLGGRDQFKGGVLVVHDLTERKRIERELQERAEEAERRKNEFLATLSHELRNPLAAVTAALHVVRHARASDEMRERALSTLERQVSHQVRLLDELLDLARMTRGKIRLRKERVDLVALVRNVLADHATDLEARGLTLETDFADEPVPVEGDSIRLAQIATNLISNALKFSRSKGRIVVSLRITSGRGGNCVQLSIADEGIGIEPGRLERIFEPFARPNARPAEGIGMGLALTRRLVELHGGDVRAASKGDERGAEFVVELPLAPAEMAATGDGVRGSDAQPRPLRVLVVEDNPDAAEALSDLLRVLGHRPEIAGDGDEAVRLARSLRPDVMLCDIALPGRSGHEVASELKSDPSTRDIRLFAFSGYGGPSDHERSLRAGFERHLVKPVGADALESLLAESGANA